MGDPLANLRLSDTPDRIERLKWARSMISDGLRDGRAQPSAKISGSKQRAREEERLVHVHARAETCFATAFIMLGHALGVENPENAL